MTVTAIVFLVVAGAVFGLIVWRLSTMTTDPEGYVRLATLDGLEAWRARTALERAHISVIVDSHRGIMGDGSYGGPTHLLVPETQVKQASKVLKETDMSSEYPPA